MIRLKQARNIFARLEGAHEQNIGLRQTEPHSCWRTSSAGNGAKARIHAQQVNGHFFDRYVEQMGQIITGRLRIDQDMIGGTDGARDLIAIVAAAVGGHELRIVQKVQIVNRDHLPPRAALGRDNVRAVQQIQPVTGQFSG